MTVASQQYVVALHEYVGTGFVLRIRAKICAVLVSTSTGSLPVLVLNTLALRLRTSTNTFATIDGDAAAEVFLSHNRLSSVTEDHSGHVPESRLYATRGHTYQFTH